MKMKVLIFVVSFLALITFSRNTGVDTVMANDNPTLTEVSYKQLDERAKILSDYLASYSSPLQYHAQDFIDAANEYGLDWRLVISIAGVESTFGKQIPGGFNGWGWGVYGSQAIYFSSWREGIFTVSKGLKEDYISRGLTDPYSMNRRYAASPAWGRKVAYFMNDLEKFANKFESETIDLSRVESTPRIAAVSGQLVID